VTRIDGQNWFKLHITWVPLVSGMKMMYLGSLQNSLYLVPKGSEFRGLEYTSIYPRIEHDLLAQNSWWYIISLY
jgi:hypothetical protein